ncbi:MAG: nitroreductase [Spirochaetes bacterium]|nr:nitroreductase [Spirochaetota bacterium]
MSDNEIIRAIKARRSIRKYSGESISPGAIEDILEAGRWAPSGLDNQPWRFSVITDARSKEQLAPLTAYSRIVKECAACIAVFYHLPDGYDRDKDAMAIGACVQNMLLAAASLGLGAVWLGEILKRKAEARDLLGVDDSCELMAVIAIGHPAESPRSSRKRLSSLILKQ